MAHEPFSSGGDNVTGGGPTSYSGSDPNVRTPALGRSSRDLAGDTGPGGAPEGMFTGPDADVSDVLTGSMAAPDVDPDAPVGRDRPPGSKVPRHPEIDPDTRLGLHPTIPSKEAADKPT